MTGRIPTALEDSAESRSLAVFSFLWAAAAMFHRAESGTWARSPLESAESLAAFWLLFHPRSGRAFLTLVSLQFLQNAVLMPHISNHTILLWIMTGTILLAAGTLFASGRYAPGRLYRAFAPALRIELLILYFYVVFHKLNPEFFAPETSCASALSNQLRSMVGLPMEIGWAHPLAVWGTIFAEAAIPVLLTVRAARMWGIALGMGFHFVVGLANFYDFSSLLFACYFLFAPADHPETLAAWWREWRDRLGVRTLRAAFEGPWWWRPLLAFAGLILLVALDPKVRLLWWIYGLAILAVHLATFRRATPNEASAREILRVRHPVLWIAPLLLFFNGMSPYLGFKTENSFSMFSNLHTEGGVSNHYLVPASSQVFDYQRDLVRILSTSERDLQRRVDTGGRIPYAALRTWVSAAAAAGRENLAIRYERGGRLRDLTHAERDPELSEPYPLLLRKLLVFRVILDEQSRGTCMH
ncbi:MAG: hypothetical protein ACE5FL_01910 [Myxococcota bacterium]